MQPTASEASDSADPFAIGFSVKSEALACFKTGEAGALHGRNVSAAWFWSEARGQTGPITKMRAAQLRP